MSQWTHVAGAIRIDCFDHEGVVEQIINVLGQTWRFGEDVYPDTEYAPYGSEGSIQYTISENPDDSSMAAFVITFYGDLRHYDNDEEIIAWFEKACNAFLIRQATITIDVERQKIVYGAYIGTSDLGKHRYSYNEIIQYKSSI